MALDPLLVICGPTAAGKTAAALEAAERLGGEIVGADSVQIYRSLDIGSAKPTAAERARAPHHLIDIIEPDERYSAARYAEDAAVAVAAIRGRGRLPIVAGGTGLYIKSLCYGLFPGPPADAAIRARLEAEAESGGGMLLHQRLAEVDPESAERLHPADLIRVVRALEVFEITGRALTEHQREHRFAEPCYRILLWAIDPGQEVLRGRIAARVEEMMDAGFVEEVHALLARGLAPDCPGLRCVGYRDLVAHLGGEIDLEEALRRVRRDHGRYARRQRTWFRGMRHVEWFASPAELPWERARALSEP